MQFYKSINRSAGLSRRECKHKNPCFCALCPGKPRPTPITHVLPRCRHLSGPAPLPHACSSAACAGPGSGGTFPGGQWGHPWRGRDRARKPLRYPAQPCIALATTTAVQGSARCQRQAAGSGCGQGVQAGCCRSWCHVGTLLGISPCVRGAVGCKGQSAECAERKCPCQEGDWGREMRRRRRLGDTWGKRRAAERGCSPAAPHPGAFLPLWLQLFSQTSSQSSDGMCTLPENGAARGSRVATRSCPGFGVGPWHPPGALGAGASSGAGCARLGGWFFAPFFPEGELILTEQTKKEGSANETQMNLGWLRGC